MKAVNESRISSWCNSPRVLDLIAKVAPYVFALGLIVLMLTAVQSSEACCSAERER